jgi:hypothetical protein
MVRKKFGWFIVTYIKRNVFVSWVIRLIIFKGFLMFSVPCHHNIFNLIGLKLFLNNNKLKQWLKYKTKFYSKYIITHVTSFFLSYFHLILFVCYCLHASLLAYYNLHIVNFYFHILVKHNKLLIFRAVHTLYDYVYVKPYSTYQDNE